MLALQDIINSNWEIENGMQMEEKMLSNILSWIVF
jgi:hypothetical protein